MTSESITRRYVQVQDRTVHYRHVGQGAPVVLLHASPRSSGTLVPLMNAAPDGFSLFAIDLPGFGRSSPLPVAWGSIEDFADALAATLDALGLARVQLYGTHTGAAVALVFAVRHAGRVSRLVLDGLSAFDDAECAGLDAYLPPLEPDASGSHMTWAWNRMRDQALFFPWNERSSRNRLWRPVPGPGSLHAAALDLLVAADHRSAYAAAFRLDPRGWVARLRVPTHIGARDNDVLRTHLDRLGSVPRCVTVSPFPSDPAAWSSAIRALLFASNDGPAPAVVDGAWRTDAIADTHRGPPAGRLHWRGCPDGNGRPLVHLHDSPGSARSLDRLLAASVGRRPVHACDLPGHAESDALAGDDLRALLDRLEQGFDAMGFDEIELCGHGIGSWLAHWLALRRPRRWSVIGQPRQRGPAPPPPHPAPRADGGHLAEAWHHARDAVILGPWWHRDPRDCVDFGDALDLHAIQRAALDQLVEVPCAEMLRRQVADLVRPDATRLSVPSASRSPTRPRSR